MSAIQEFETLDLDNVTKTAEIRALYKLAKKFNSFLNIRLK